MTEIERFDELCEDLSPLTFHDCINSVKKSNLVILDVRTSDEYKNGHIKGAVNIDFFQKDFSMSITKLNPNSNFFIYCRRGNRSKKTLEMMRAMGYPQLHQLLQGIEGWVRCELPLTKE